MTVLQTLQAAIWNLLLDARHHARRDEGQTMAEYGLILAGVAVIVMATVWLLGGAINATFANIVAQF